MEKTASKGDRPMSAVATNSLRQFAAFEWPETNHKGRLRALCRMLPWSDRRVRAVYNGESGVSLRADEFAAVEQLTKGAEDAVRRSQETYRTLEARIATLEALFQAGDEEFGSQHMAALRSVTHGKGNGLA
jgi:hypothetical protein